MEVVDIHFALLLQLGHKLKFVLDHPQQGLQSGWLFCSEQGLDGLGDEIRVAADDKLLQKVFSDLVSDTLMMSSNLRRVGLQGSDQYLISQTVDVRLVLVLSVVALDDVGQNLNTLVAYVVLLDQHLSQLWVCRQLNDVKQALSEDLKVLNDEVECLARRIVGQDE